jgi:hypothetical protein
MNGFGYFLWLTLAAVMNLSCDADDGERELCHVYEMRLGEEESLGLCAEKGKNTRF